MINSRVLIVHELLYHACSTNMVRIYVIVEGAFVFILVYFLYFRLVLNKTIIPLALAGYEKIIANLALCASFDYHLMSNARSRKLVEH